MIHPTYDFRDFPWNGYFLGENSEIWKFSEFSLDVNQMEFYNFFSPDETDDMESLFHIAGIGDYLDQLIIPSHE